MIKDFSSSKNVYFIGIGGIGISAIARLMLLEGKKVSGSDRSQSKVTDELEEVGAKIYIGQNDSNIPSNCDLVIYTVAIPQDNKEILEAKDRNISVLTYPEALGIISKNKFTIAISGTHGKTTTTAMVTKILMDEKYDPTVIVGSLMKDENGNSSNFIAGKSKYLVVEADEYKKAFLNLSPQILVITNIDEDHLDFYKDLSEIQSTFKELALKVPESGILITDVNNPHIKGILEDLKCKIVNFKDVDLTEKLMVPGEHNRLDAKAAISAAIAIDIPFEKAQLSLTTYKGVWRRFELKGETSDGAIIYDDYAHNPQKVQAALSGAREMYPDKTITAIFQPHLFSRTKSFLHEFGQSFTDADRIILAPIFPAREVFDPTINSKMLCDEIIKNGKKAVSFESFEEILEYLKKLNLGENDLVITIGAGEAYKIGETLLNS